MKRRLLNFFSTLSLLLFMAACVLWVRSYAYYDGFERTFRHREHGLLEYHLFSQNGRLVGYRTYTVGLPFVLRWDVVRMSGTRAYMRKQREDRACEHHLLGFGVNWGIISRIVVVPYWFVALTLAAAPAVRLLASRRPREPGACRRCGYDLRATPDRCPECGTPAIA